MYVRAGRPAFARAYVGVHSLSVISFLNELEVTCLYTSNAIFYTLKWFQLLLFKTVC